LIAGPRCGEIGGDHDATTRLAMNWLDWLPENVSTYGADVDGVLAVIWYTTLAWFVLTFGVLFAGFEVFFFAILGAFGRSLLGAVVWWAIFTGNLLASAGMLALLLRAQPRLPAALIGSWSGVLREGAVAGLIGAALVMAWFLALDALQGQPLRTPRLLGAALLGQPEPLDAVLAYSVLHVLAFLAFGGLSAALVAAADHQPLFLFPLVILYVAFEVFIFAVVLVLARWVFDELPGWAVVVGNLLAASGMLAYYVTGHPQLARRVVSALAEEGQT
jgi:hypothetical protein